jgi:Arc/MetJ-type ribon-helix-helix transcriptional regulator
MAVHLSPKTQARINDMMAATDFTDADAMIEEALELLEERERLLHLRELLAVGAEQAARGELIPYDDEFRRKARENALRRLAAGESPSPDVCP